MARQRAETKRAETKRAETKRAQTKRAQTKRGRKAVGGASGVKDHWRWILPIAVAVVMFILIFWRLIP